MPIGVKPGVSGIGIVIGFPTMPSWLWDIRRTATEDCLTAMKCRPIGTDGTIKGSPVSARAPQHHNFTSTSPRAALSANINDLRTDLLLRVWLGAVIVEGFLSSDGEVLRHGHV